MVADLVSADYGWFQSSDGSEEAQVLFKVGKNCEGYFTLEDILKQTEKAITILEKYYPNEDHVLVYDNNSPDGALSDQKMPTFTSKLESNWLVEVNAVGENGKVIYTPDRKILKTKIQMQDATDGTNQSLYFPAGHKKEGLFKGMAVILQECGLIEESQLKAQCNAKFDFPNKSQTKCCCHHILYNQPDFVQVESLLETYCKSCGVNVIFLPKFHCKLNHAGAMQSESTRTIHHL